MNLLRFIQTDKENDNSQHRNVKVTFLYIFYHKNILQHDAKFRSKGGGGGGVLIQGSVNPT